jgi:fatty-acyl-CoA synthase
MQGLMQDRPLLISNMIVHAAKFHGSREIVSRLVEGPIHTTNYAEVEYRSRKLAHAMAGFGIKHGDRVGTLAWNTFRHLEIWYAVSGMGSVCHTLNPRLFPDQIVYIANHAQDRLLFVDLTFLPLVETIIDRLTSVEAVILMSDRTHLPASSKIPNLMVYEDFLDQGSDDYAWPQFDETTASSLCYTSGTTGNPKGVLYSHRSTSIHSLACNSADALGIRSVDSVLPVVPMFHANAWSLPYGCAMTGSKMVMPGAAMDGKSIHELLESQQVTFTAAVPTVWLGLLQYLEAGNLGLSSLKRVVIGGSACPRSMIEAFEVKYGVDVFHAWGMTETSPLGTVGALKAGMEDWDLDKRLDAKVKQGRLIFGIDMKITGDDDKALPHDGKAFGNLKVRGPWVVGAYFKGDGGAILDDQGFFDTGDVATIDPDGFMQITDRAKDVIKSGGEWISSIEIENLTVGHPDVAEAAVIGIAHPKWDERPLLIIVPKSGRSPTKADLLAYLSDKIAKWWMPDDVVFVSEIPHTATGKIQKTTLRSQFANHKLAG